MSLTDEQIADLEFRVEDGAEFLDAVMPGWWRRVALSRLALGIGEIGECETNPHCGCVVAQLSPVGQYSAFNVGLGITEASRYGFTMPDRFSPTDRDAWNVLQRKWEEVILDRRAA